MKVKYASNGVSVGDGTRITRVSNSGSVFEVMTDEKAGRFSPLELSGGAVQAEPDTGFAFGASRVTDGGIEYGCSFDLQSKADHIALAGREFSRVLYGGGSLPSTYTINGEAYAVEAVKVTPDGNNQSALAFSFGAGRSKPTILVLPPSERAYRYSNVIDVSENTYVTGYGARLVPLGLRDTALQMASNSGLFGLAMHGLDASYTRWPERHEATPAKEGAKDGSVSNAGGSGWSDAWVTALGKSNVALVDLDTRGSLTGALRCTSENVLVQNCSAFRSHSDSFHIVKQSRNVTLRRVHVYDGGDDGISMIQYKDSAGGAQPSNIYLEECTMKGGRARGFTAVSAKDVFMRRCVVEGTNLAPYYIATTGAHSLADTVGVKLRDCEGWRGGRMQAPSNQSAGFAALLTADGHSITGAEITGCKSRVYGSDWYKGAGDHVRAKAVSGTTIGLTQSGNDFAAIDETA